MKHFHLGLVSIITALTTSFAIASVSGKIKNKVFDTPLGCFISVLPIGSPTLPPALNPNPGIKCYVLPHTFPSGTVNQFPVNEPTGSPIDIATECVEFFTPICCYEVAQVSTTPVSYKVTGVCYSSRP